jgi:hypothetical protein
MFLYQMDLLAKVARWWSRSETLPAILEEPGFQQIGKSNAELEC